MKGYQYYKPETVEEAIRMMASLDGARYIAGGTDVMVLIKQKKILPLNLISLRNIRELSLLETADGLRIGSGVTYNRIVQNEPVRDSYTALADAVERIGSPQVRNVATVAGNICNAAPSADTACPLLVLDAEVLIAAKGGNRNVAIADFFLGPNKTILEQGEIVKAIVIPKPSENTGSAYIKHTRRKAMELPLIGVAARVTLDTAGSSAVWKEKLHKTGDPKELIEKIKSAGLVLRDVRVAMGVVSPKPMRAVKAEGFLSGKVVSEALLAEAGAIAASESQPRDSFRCEAWYRKDMVQVLVKRAVMMSIERIVNVK